MQGECHGGYGDGISPLSRDECNASAALLGLPVHASLARLTNLSGQPSGCFVNLGAEVRYNADAPGQARGGRTLVCGVTKKPAATGMPLYVHVRLVVVRASAIHTVTQLVWTVCSTSARGGH